MLRGFDQPRQHGVWVYLEYTATARMPRPSAKEAMTRMMSSVGTCLPCNGVPRVSWKYLWHARHWSWRHGPPPGWPLVRMLPHPANHSRHTFPRGNNGCVCATAAWSRSTAVRHQVAAWAECLLTADPGRLDDEARKRLWVCRAPRGGLGRPAIDGLHRDWAPQPQPRAEHAQTQESKQKGHKI